MNVLYWGLWPWQQKPNLNKNGSHPAHLHVCPPEVQGTKFMGTGNCSGQTPSHHNRPLFFADPCYFFQEMLAQDPQGDRIWIWIMCVPGLVQSNAILWPLVAFPGKSCGQNHKLAYNIWPPKFPDACLVMAWGRNYPEHVQMGLTIFHNMDPSIR